ncbi:MAG: flagellar biosynthesis protein FlhF [Lachnospiraceae bacterium]|nr:flagellar biosynthesis protein FlhF [Lachnospiraceae bacterium]
MIIKKFTGKTKEEAVEAARKDMGSGVVVMNVKDVKRKGIAALFLPKQVEITAALEEHEEPRPIRREQTRGGAADSGEKDSRARGDRAAVPTSGGAWGTQQENSQSIEKKLDSLQTLLLSRFQQEEAARNTQPAAEPQEDADEEKQEISEQERFVKLLYNTMLENEVDEKYANQIIDELEKGKNGNIPFDYILSNVYQKLILKFGKAEGIKEAESGPRLVLFMGPTGVGKTTTIAKIASHFVMDEKKRLALLTADTYRIAAAEQLRTYANILEVPFRVVYTKEEAAAAVADFNDYDYIFVDTAGHSHQNEEQLNNMRELMDTLKQAGEYQTFLVLSATTKYRDLLKIASNYEEVSDYQMIFTKLDETSTLGNLLNLKLYTDAEIAYVTCGQNVPEDIEQFNPQKTVKQLLSMRH